MSAPRVLGRARVDDAAGIPLPDLLSELPERALGDNATFCTRLCCPDRELQTLIEFHWNGADFHRTAFEN